MSNADQFNLLFAKIQSLDLRTGDVIRVGQNPFGILTHYLVYVCTDNWGQQIFALNTPDRNVHYASTYQLVCDHNIEAYHLKSVRRAPNGGIPLGLLQNRVGSQQGKRYDLVSYNCEHFANMAQYGNATSLQTNWGILALVGLAVYAYARLANEKS